LSIEQTLAQANETARIEAFSDGTVAIAIMAALLLAFVSVAVSVTVNLVLALFFELPPRKQT
jgi:uncharacterized membrane protein